MERLADDHTAGASSDLREELASWLVDPDLTTLRDARSLRELPESERQQCLSLWDAVSQSIVKIDAAE
jgi:hypothetical protein